MFDELLLHMERHPLAYCHHPVYESGRYVRKIRGPALYVEEWLSSAEKNMLCTNTVQDTTKVLKQNRHLFGDSQKCLLSNGRDIYLVTVKNEKAPKGIEEKGLSPKPEISN
eukprot:5654018-Amphidinium_carterae.1